ncbi:DUF4148 domain-containing protein [Paraburkholderia caribensis]|uniref:DUF4148 domain-containing protein n=1 Tax=Paraburkholderia caribensis TaxID=75105 RepID=UPI001CAAA42C|nr:DUF4148 domain-containing protein [Paraburkholderia caribensis]CAG9263193.1 exported hypothetical protein [Paraburkholderia caribensis]
MKSCLNAIVFLCASGVPALASAKVDDNSERTRAGVRAELIRLEQAGYRPGQSEDLDYPNDIQAAEVKAQASDSKSNGLLRTGSRNVRIEP